MKIEHKNLISLALPIQSLYTYMQGPHMLQTPAEALDFQKKLKVAEPPWCLFKFVYSWLQQTGVIPHKHVRVPAKPRTEGSAGIAFLTDG